MVMVVMELWLKLRHVLLNGRGHYWMGDQVPNCVCRWDGVVLLLLRPCCQLYWVDLLYRLRPVLRLRLLPWLRFSWIQLRIPCWVRHL